MADVSVRPARPEDAERVATIQLSTWRTAYAQLLPAEALAVPEVEVAAVWLAAIERPPTPDHRLLVAMDGAELVGFAASGPEDAGADGTAVGELLTLLVEPRWGRRGHGSRLLAATVDTWRAAGTVAAVAWLLERDVVSTGFLLSTGWELDGQARGLDTGPRVERQLRLHCSLT